MHQNKEAIVEDIDMLRNRLRTHYLGLGERLFFGGRETEAIEFFLQRVDIEKDNCLKEIENVKSLS